MFKLRGLNLTIKYTVQDRLNQDGRTMWKTSRTPYIIGHTGHPVSCGAPSCLVVIATQIQFAKASETTRDRHDGW